MVVFGGVSYSDIILGDVWLFNPSAPRHRRRRRCLLTHACADDDTWMKANPKGAQVILPREGHSATVVKTKMYVFGGISYGHTPFNDLWTYDLGAPAAARVWMET